MPRIKEPNPTNRLIRKEIRYVKKLQSQFHKFYQEAVDPGLKLAWSKQILFATQNISILARLLRESSQNTTQIDASVLYVALQDQLRRELGATPPPLNSDLDNPGNPDEKPTPTLLKRVEDTARPWGKLPEGLPLPTPIPLKREEVRAREENERDGEEERAGEEDM